ncbi:MAG: hypothetical protein ABI542_11605 [Gemmatimonadota bacterium]
MNLVRKVRALLVVAVAWGALTALVYTVIASFTSLGGPLRPGLTDFLRTFGFAWAVSTVSGLIVGLGLMAVARGRRLQELSNWRIAGAGALAGFVLVLGFIGVFEGFRDANLSLWLYEFLPAAVSIALLTGACTLVLTAIARRGADRDLLADVDAVELLPPG